MLKFRHFSNLQLQSLSFISDRILYSTSSSLSSTVPSLQILLSDYLGSPNHKPLSSSSDKISQFLQSQASSKRVSHSDFAKNVTSVVEFFIGYGFEHSQIRKIISYRPEFLSAKVDKTLTPKIELLQDLGVSGSDLVDAILANPRLLSRRMDPAVTALRSVLGSDSDVVKIVRRSNWLDFDATAKHLIPNVHLLLNYGIPIEKIQGYVVRQPRIFIRQTDVFRNLLIRVDQKFGIPRDSTAFLPGLFLACFKEETIEAKCDVFKSFGWTQSDVLTLLRKNPYCFGQSVARIEKKLEFLVKELGFEPAYLATRPSLMTYSLEKRLLPRHRMLCFLKERGLLTRDHRLPNVACLTESMFLKKFVEPYKDVVPDIHQVYLSIGDPVLLLAQGRASSL